MGDPIEANYVPDGDDWTVTVRRGDQRLTGTAPGIIAARDRADQLVEELAPGEAKRVVVHLLGGDALEFTTAYLTARMTTAEPAPAEPAAPARKTPGPRAPLAEESSGDGAAATDATDLAEQPAQH
ncbi:MAG TPA: hypothetical protein VFV67_12455 [Actinophytocola sp.]|uniref:hypothetical protein n=1 Tax=Actinophytocola sp. TaxID=1872138 RepID=UPI002DBF6E5E|nr:hypothetical protein [Actinophytocola sp.]HEU5471458.1 hypothetical protein [Actinophytocola sp.]